MIIELYKLLAAKNEFVISKQLLRSGTNIGANIEEAIAGQSKKDFIHKMAIALKEARKSRYWLKLLDKSQIAKMDYKKAFGEIVKYYQHCDPNYKNKFPNNLKFKIPNF